MEIDKFAKKLRERFEFLKATEGLTKVKLARKLNTSRPQINRLLHFERHNVTIDSLLKFAFALKIPMSIRLV